MIHFGKEYKESPYGVHNPHHVVLYAGSGGAAVKEDGIGIVDSDSESRGLAM